MNWRTEFRLLLVLQLLQGVFSFSYGENQLDDRLIILFVAVGLLFVCCVLGRLCCRRYGPATDAVTIQPAVAVVTVQMPSDVRQTLTPPPKYEEVTSQIFFGDDLYAPPSYESAIRSTPQAANHI